MSPREREREREIQICITKQLTSTLITCSYLELYIVWLFMVLNDHCTQFVFQETLSTNQYTYTFLTT